MKASQRWLLAGAGVAGGIAAGAVAAVVAAGRRWDAAVDPTDGRPLDLPDHAELTVRTADGAELAVAVIGEGADLPTVVCIHGWTNDRRVWAPVARLLADGHRVVLYDQRGHGRSTAGSADMSIDVLGDDLAAVLGHLDVRDAVIAGHSMGGMATQAFAIRHPAELRDRVKGLVLVSTLCVGVRRPGVNPAIVGLPIVNRMFANPRIGRMLVRGASGRIVSTAQLDANATMFRATSPASRARFLAAILAMDLSAGVGSIDVPVELVVGTRDTVTPASSTRALAELLPTANVEVIADAGHMLPWEEPQRIAKIIAAASTG